MRVFLFFLLAGASLLFMPQSVYANAALVRPPNNLGLMGYWSFNEATTTVAGDFSGNGNHATFVGNATWGSGKHGAAMTLDGNGDYAQAPSLTPPSRGTIALWLKSTDFSGVRRVWGTDTNFEFVLIDGDGAFDLCGATSIGTAATLNANQWYHVVATWDDVAETQTIYVDGVFSASDTQTISCTQTAAFLIGRRPGALDAEAFLGTLDEVRMYTRALSASEVAALYRAGATRQIASSKTLTNGSSLEQNLIRLWTFDGGDMNWTSDTAGTAYERSGNVQHGTLTGANRTFSQVIGKLGQSLRLDGSNNYVSTPSFVSPSSGTVALWLKGDNFGKVNRVWGNDTNFEFVITDAESPLFDICGATSIDGGDLVQGQWHHVAIAWNDVTDTHQIYIDGAVTVNGSTGITCGQTDLFLVGYQPDAADTTQSFEGSLDEVRVYNRALSASEVKQLYTLGKTIISP